MPDLRTHEATECRWRLERWPTDRTIAHLVFIDMLAVPSLDDFDEAFQRAIAQGATAVRTSALFPRSQHTAVKAGYSPIDQLILMRRDLTSPPASSPTPSAPGSVAPNGVGTGPLRSWHLTNAAEIDRLSFGSPWANSTNSLLQIKRATQRARARVVQSSPTARSRIDGFVLSGISDRTGYVQRLAVHPDRRRRGIATALVADAIEWMQRRSATAAFVNTGVDNITARALYERFGFEDTGEVLTINERRSTSIDRRRPWVELAQ